MDIDTRTGDNRVEWVHLRYHNIFDPGQAYEIDLDWMVCTSHTIADTVAQWARKAVTNSLHMVPIPHDPFALPFEGRADPLRGPIYINLKLECLPKVLSGVFLFKLLEFLEFLEFLSCSKPFLNGRLVNFDRALLVASSRT